MVMSILCFIQATAAASQIGDGDAKYAALKQAR